MAKTLLLVEDERIIAMNECTILEKHGFAVLSVDTGELAVATVRKNPEIDLVLMDIDLGRGMDGTQAAREILSIHDIPIVFLSSHAEREYVDRVKEITRYGYVLKTAGEFVLVEAIDMALKLFEAHQELAEREAEARALASRMMRYERMVECASDLISVTDEDDNLVYVNDRHEQLLGYRTDELLGTNPALLLHPEDLKRAVEKHNDIRRDETNSVDVWRFRHKDGTYRTFECRGSVYRDGDGRKATVVVSHDVTDSVRSRAALRWSEARFEAFMDHLPGAAFLKNERNEVLYCNHVYAALAGTEQTEGAPGGEPQALPPELEVRYRRENRRVIEEREVLRSESRFPTPDGDTWWLTYKFPVVVGEETLLGAISFDICEQKRTERELEALLDQKQQLLRELNHRVKNNLAMVLSLIRLKDSELGVAADLSDLVSLIDSVRSVHERLEQTQTADRLALKPYVQDLLSAVFSFSTRQPVVIDNDIDDIELSTKLTVPLGLILSELATNAAKHGFSRTQAPRFSVSMVIDAATSRYVLTVSNNGAPFPEEVGMNNCQTLGVRLVSALVGQLGGHIELSRTPHPVFTITWPMEEDR
jgi:PAS domain S-box-containing protein